jgi:flagellar basal-body rod protein FlgB
LEKKPLKKLREWDKMNTNEKTVTATARSSKQKVRLIAFFATKCRKRQNFRKLRKQRIKGAQGTMEAITNNSLLMMQRSMHYLWQKQTCILDNIANVETPNYKTKYVTFEESLENAIQSAAQQGNQGTTADIRQAIESAQVEVKEAQESTRMDDNGVNITEQAIELARNGYQLQYVMDSISSDFSMLRTAIRG